MHIDRIEDALEAKRQLLGARSLLREASMPGFKLKVADFKGVSGAAISWSSEWPAHLVLTCQTFLNDCGDVRDFTTQADINDWEEIISKAEGQ